MGEVNIFSWDWTCGQPQRQFQFENACYRVRETRLVLSHVEEEEEEKVIEFHISVLLCGGSGGGGGG